MQKICVIIGVKKEQGYRTTYKNDWMESIKRLVQSKFEKFKKIVNKDYTKEEEEEEGTIDRIANL